MVKCVISRNIIRVVSAVVELGHVKYSTTTYSTPYITRKGITMAIESSVIYAIKDSIINTLEDSVIHAIDKVLGLQSLSNEQIFTIARLTEEKFMSTLEENIKFFLNKKGDYRDHT